MVKDPTMARRVFITVAEVSGDRHAAQLIHSLKQLDPEMIVEGLGGPAMQAAGAIIHRNTVARAAMGWRGAASDRSVQGAAVDPSAFSDESAGRVDRGGFPKHEFSLCACRQGAWDPDAADVCAAALGLGAWRMKKLRKWVDRLACILPFEETYFLQHGVNATFVGHPLFDELPTDHGDERGARYPAASSDHWTSAGIAPVRSSSQSSADDRGRREAAGGVCRHYVSGPDD